MFLYSEMHWIAFFSAAVLLNISPGPDLAYILGQAARGGRRAGFAAMFGIWAGALVHVAAAATGLSAIVVSSGAAFMIIKWIGAGYLLWLGITALTSSEPSELPCEGLCRSASSTSLIARQGFLVAVLNPKVAVFFLAFLPQFVVPGAGPVWAQLTLHGVLIIVVAAVIEPPIVIVGHGLAQSLGASSSEKKWLDRSMGTIFIGLAVRLFATEK